MWFKRIYVKEYDELIKNKNKIYNITPRFSSDELLNKYRDDDNIHKTSVGAMQLLFPGCMW